MVRSVLSKKASDLLDLVADKRSTAFDGTLQSLVAGMTEVLTPREIEYLKGELRKQDLKQYTTVEAAEEQSRARESLIKKQLRTRAQKPSTAISDLAKERKSRNRDIQPPNR